MTTMPRANVPTARNAESVAQGADGNERLIAWGGAALLVGFGFEGITLLTGVRDHLKLHMLIGVALLIPTGIKVAATLYRFAKYYLNSPDYVRKGPPQIVLRIIAPFLVMNTAFILLSGILIPLTASSRHLIEGLHKLSLWTWLALVGIHVLWYLWRVPRLMIADLAGRGTTYSAALQRIAVVAGGGVAGIALAVALFGWIKAFVAG